MTNEFGFSLPFDISLSSCTRRKSGLYLDFEVPKIGIFRVVYPKLEMEGGLSKLNWCFKAIASNKALLQKVIAYGGKQVYSECERHPNWGKGWQWVETAHALQPEGWGMRRAEAWNTCPFGGAVLEESMESLYREEIPINDGIILEKLSKSNQPEDICYFFPKKK